MPDTELMLTVPEAIEEFRRGKFIIITDDEDRENEGDLVMAAQFVTPEAINFMAKYGRGLVCTALTDDRVAQLGLPMMVDNNSSRFGTPFTVSVVQPPPGSPFAVTLFVVRWMK